MNEVVEQLKSLDEKYCSSCGKIIKNETVICPNCAAQVKDLSVSTPAANYAKDKTVAILLAVFLGFWVWIYTWELDQWKFWTGLGVTLITVGIAGIGFQIWAIVDAASRTPEFYLNYPNKK